ncbi:DNA adenine methylase [bacterium]
MSNTLLAEEKQILFDYPISKEITGRFQIQNRRFLGNKYKLLNFIEDILNERCGEVKTFFDVFSGTGVVGHKFNSKKIKIISNDILQSNYLPLKVFLGTFELDWDFITATIESLNSLQSPTDNYFSKHFANRYFTLENARKIGLIRQKIKDMDINDNVRAVLITSLIYAVDKVANTVGHYDAFRKIIDMTQPLKLLIPEINLTANINNEVYSEDSNTLVRRIKCDVLYMDPPYNSRQYCDAYHLLENLATWEKPQVFGKAKKMDRSHLKSKYCLISATEAFDDFINNAKCKHILLSYNNTRETKDGRSNSRIKDPEIVRILKQRGSVEVFERDYRAFTAGKSDTDSHTERIFYCEVNK